MAATTHRDARPRVFPFYVVCDVSKSMWDPRRHPPAHGPSPFDVLQDSIPQLLFEVEINTLAKDAARISVISFADDARMVLPLTRPGDVSRIEELKRGGFTNYEALFGRLRDTIRRDCEDLARSYKLRGPAVFFLTDGRPEVGGVEQSEALWGAARDGLVSPGFPHPPKIAAFGLGDPIERTLCRVATVERGLRLAFVALRADQVVEVLRGIIPVILQSISASVEDGERLVLETPPRMRRVSCDA
jgi:uncharacterized protein YegL